MFWDLGDLAFPKFWTRKRVFLYVSDFWILKEEIGYSILVYSYLK